MGSDLFRDRLRDAHVSATSRLAFPECQAGIARAVREGRVPVRAGQQLTRAFDRRWDEILVLELDVDLMKAAGSLSWRHPLRGGDAIHLASAITFRAGGHDLAFACWDRRLWEAAAAEGFVMIPAEAP